MRFRRSYAKVVLSAAEVERRLYGAPLPDINKAKPALSGGALEATAIINKLQGTNRKGTVMPDLQSALKNAIETWEPTPTNKPVQQQPKESTMSKPLFPIKNNVTRATFDYIKAHPNTTAAAACKDLVKEGYKPASVTALMAQFVRAGQAVRDNNHGYRVLQDAYTPMKAAEKYSKKPKAHKKVKPATTSDHKRPQATASEGIAALQTEATAKRVTNILVFPKTPEETVKHMNVFQAKELYEYLKKMFGG